MRKCFAIYNRNEEQRLLSTSGGVFYLLAKKIIEDNGLVFGASYTSDKQVVHKYISKVQEISDLQGAKYVQSTLGGTFFEVKEALISGRKVLFSGTPCQIAGLKKYLEEDYENLLTIDLVCHGVPSPLAWKEYLEYRRIKDEQKEIADEINVRSKVTGWSHYAYSVEFRYKSGKIYQQVSGQDPYMQAFISNMTLRASCNNCKFKGLSRCSDLTLGDFWGIWNSKPEMDDNKGTSLVIVHSAKGQEYLKQIRKDCVITKVTEEEAYGENPSLMEASAINPDRDEVLCELEEQSFSIVIDELRKTKKSKNSSKMSCIFKRIWKK